MLPVTEKVIENAAYIYVRPFSCCGPNDVSTFKNLNFLPYDIMTGIKMKINDFSH
jgi:hypothetical protein